MRVAITIQHPAHVHFFRNAIDELENKGHEVAVFAREKGLAIDLLDRFGIDHEVLAGASNSLPALAARQATYELRLLRRVRQFKPDVLGAIGGVAAAHVASVTNARSVVFYDTEHATFVTRLAYPFADRICTPESYREDLGEKHRQYAGCHEMAYLHPDRFTPDTDVLEDLGFEPTTPVVVVRLSDWNASHDVGASGFVDPRKAVEKLEEAGARVFVAAEGENPTGIGGDEIPVGPHQIHDLLSAADLFVGEGATMAAESAVLGTPAVYVNSLSMGYTDWLEDHGLLFGYHGHDRHHRALEQAERLLRSDTDWEAKRERLIDGATDTTRVIVGELEQAGDL